MNIPMKKAVCPKHNVKMELVHGRYGPYYKCHVMLPAPSVETCDCSGGRSKFDKMIYVTDQETRDWKHKAHAAFDILWKKTSVPRSVCYSWLADQLGMEPKCCHIQHFDTPMLQRVIQLCKKEGKEFVGMLEEVYDHLLEEAIDDLKVRYGKTV